MDDSERKRGKNNPKKNEKTIMQKNACYIYGKPGYQANDFPRQMAKATTLVILHSFQFVKRIFVITI